MGTVAQAVDAISLHGKEPHPRVRTLARHLIDDGLLPKSAGKRYEHVNSLHLAILLLAVCTAPTQGAAARCAITWGRLTPGGKRIDLARATETLETLLIEMMAAMIDVVWAENGDGPNTNRVLLSAIEITATHPHAIVDIGGHRQEFLPVGGEPEFSGFHRVVRIHGATLRRIAMDLLADTSRPAQPRTADLLRPFHEGQAPLGL